MSCPVMPLLASPWLMRWRKRTENSERILPVQMTDPLPFSAAPALTTQGSRPLLQDPTIQSPEERRCLENPHFASPSSGVYCGAAWDSLHCWPATKAGETINLSCAEIFKDVPHLLAHADAFAHRECGGGGEWLRGGWTNYSQCLYVIEKQTGSSGVVEAVSYITFIGALLSLLTLLIAVFIFSCFRSLECDRLRVHRNLMAALILLFLVMLILTEPFISHRQTFTYRDVDWLCKSLLTLRMYAQMASINWMFVEGLFLHSRLTSNVFDSRAPFPLYYTIGWGWPLVFLAAWSSTMAFRYPAHCWQGYATLPFIWILVGPMVAALVVNLLFLVNIVRILVTKLRASNAQVRKAVKATLVLFPLLGTTNLLFAVNPADNGNLEGAYMLANALLQSSQGIFVSVLYCFLNNEVQDVLRQRWQQYRTRWPDFSRTRRRGTKSSGDPEPSSSFTSNFKTHSSVQVCPQLLDANCSKQQIASSQTLHSIVTQHTPDCRSLPHQTLYPRQLSKRALSEEQIQLKSIEPLFLMTGISHPPCNSSQGSMQHRTTIV